MGKVFVKFPKTGLGNLMLVWARARVFAYLNNLPLITSSWWALRPGTWIRNERKKRFYWKYFKESTLLQRLEMRFVLHLKDKQVVREPEAKILSNKEKKDYHFLFNAINVDNDLFGYIRNHREFIKKEIYQIINPDLINQLDKLDVPVISVHIRRGDFKLGNAITPESFFIETITQIRNITGELLPVTVFTDAEENEISNVLKLPATILASPKADILDILLMSKSEIIVLSQSSSFSYWSAFLSEAIVILPHNDWQSNIRNNRDHGMEEFTEIRWQGSADNITQLKASLNKIRSHGN
jgi:hypothetical protein